MSEGKKWKRIVLSWILVLCLTMSLIPESFATWAAELGTTDYESMSMEELLSRNESLTWVFAGDSITHNGSWSQGMNGHAEWFEQYLYEVNRGSDVVVNTAWGNADVYDFLYYDDTPDGQGAKANPGMGLENMITSYNPDVIFIKIGMNNRGMSNATFIKYYNLMLDSILAEGEKNNKIPKIILLSPTPVSGENVYDQQVIPDRNEVRSDNLLRFSDMIGEIAKERGMTFCNLYKVFLQESLVLGDDYRQTIFTDPSDSSIHPNAAGQYLIFKTVCKTLGIYDETMPIFQFTYDDINSAALYTDSTYNLTYDNDYDANQATDNAEMNGTMPQLTELLASIDFTSTNGTFSSSKIDLTNASVMTDSLTLNEAQSLKNQFSIVFRAKLNAGSTANQALMFLSANGDANRSNALCIGVPSKNDNMYYVVWNSGVKKTTSTELSNNTTFAVDSKKTNVDGEWHTIAIVQDTSSYTYYVDGDMLYTCDYKMVDDYAIGDAFKGISEEQFIAQLGAYSTDLNSNWWLNGNMDYFQFYRGAITSEQVKELSVNTPEQMNQTMPELTQKAVASVDLNSETGHFKGVAYANSTRVDMTNASVMTDPLTLSEMKNMKKEYSVVFRAKLDSGSTGFQPVLFVSGSGSATLNNSLRIGVSGTSDQFYYEINAGGGEITTSANTFAIDSNKAIVNGEWHTVAIVQEETQFVYYIDGVVVATKEYCLKDGNHISDAFASATEDSFDAYIGGFHSTLTNYSLKGDMDYYQLYDVALTAEQVTELALADSGTDAEEMNKAMPKLDTKLIATVDFDSTNGTFNGNEYASATKIDMTDADLMDDALTLAEAQDLEGQFSIVFRAKLNVGSTANQAVLYASATGTTNRSNSFCVGVPSGSGGTYYTVATGGTRKTTSSSTTFTVDSSKKTVDGNWHTIAIVQNDTQYLYYVDGVQISATDCKLNNYKIGTVFKSATETDFAAHIGTYSEESSVKNFTLKGKMDFYQMYDTALTAEQISQLSVASEQQPVTWSNTKAETFVWAVAGAEQMAGYEGISVNRSLFRLLDNVMRGGADNVDSMRDIRLLNLATRGNSVEKMLASYETEIATHEFDVLMILPEISQVYASDYVHSQELVDTYAENLKKLIAKNKDAITVLWTPLASNDVTINTYIDGYADAVREITSNDANILFFDANRFMNENMTANVALKRNWFENSMYISPLCAVDVAKAFYTTIGTAGTGIGELTNHNLRYTTDKRVFKGPYVRDYIEPDVTVTGTKITVDVSVIKSAYPNLENIKVAVLPYVGAGNYNEDIFYMDSYSFEAPYSNPIITVYGEENGVIYRFKDVEVNVTTTATLDKTVNPTGAFLDDLQIVGAPEIAFSKEQTTYDVSLYQYQKQIQVRATAQEGLTITVDGKEVESGVNSHLIAVDASDSVTVTVSGNISGQLEEKAYTVCVTRPEYADIIVTEVMMDGYDDCYDLIEIYNASGKELDLKDYSIGYKTDYVYTQKEYINYYFTGNNEVFQSRLHESPTHTGINQITKYSGVWSNSEPESIPFPADSTMVIWVKYAKTDDAGKGANLTYDTLIQALKENSSYAAVVPDKDQLVVAEVPIDEKLPVKTEVHLSTSDSVSDYFYLDNNADGLSNKARDWFFILKKTAKQAKNGAITLDGDDIISAAMQNRVAATPNLSSVLQYNTERGMAVLRDSDATGNVTTFGAIEYWQKPWDSSDLTSPVMSNKTLSSYTVGSTVDISIEAEDEKELRAVELYIRDYGDESYTKITQDYILQSGIDGKGTITITRKENFNYQIELNNTMEYYVVAIDGNNNKTNLGSKEEPLMITASTVEKITDISEYRGEDYTAPEISSNSSEWIFAGWYTDAACTVPLENDVVSGEAYAKYVNAELLTVKAQVTNGIINDESSTYNGKYAIRFVASVDTLNYRNVGFCVIDENGIEASATTNTVYEKINSTIGQVGESQTMDVYTFSPKLVCTDSEYFITAKLAVATEDVNEDYTVRAFWTTLDGTQVFGKARCVSVSDASNDTININVKTELDAETTYTATLGSITDAKVEILTTGKGYTNIRIITSSDISALPSATEVILKDSEGTVVLTNGKTIYRNYYTSYDGEDGDTSWYDVDPTAKEFVIASDADLWGFKNLVNDSSKHTYSWFKDKTVVLVRDVIMNEGEATADGWSAAEGATIYSDWNGIGITKNSDEFNGTFDGDGNTIRGLVGTQGLFLRTGYSGIIKDIRFENCYISGVNNIGVAAGIHKGDLLDVYAGQDVFVIGSGFAIGGLVGTSDMVTIHSEYPEVDDINTYSNCWFAGTAQGKTNVGGILGRTYEMYPEKTHKILIENCLNTGSVTATTAKAGGIVGIVVGTSAHPSYIEIRNSVNMGAVTSANPVYAGDMVGSVGNSKVVVCNVYVKDYVTNDTEGYPANGESTSSIKNLSITGAPKMLTSEQLVGKYSYINTELDFEKFWVATEDGPQLKKFASSDTVDLTKVTDTRVNDSWYYNGKTITYTAIDSITVTNTEK